MWKTVFRKFEVIWSAWADHVTSLFKDCLPQILLGPFLNTLPLYSNLHSCYLAKIEKQKLGSNSCSFGIRVTETFPSKFHERSDIEVYFPSKTFRQFSGCLLWILFIPWKQQRRDKVKPCHNDSNHYIWKKNEFQILF